MSSYTRPTLVGTLLTATAVLFVLNFYVFVSQLSAREGPALIALPEEAIPEPPALLCSDAGMHVSVLHIRSGVELLAEQARELESAASLSDRSVRIVVNRSGERRRP